MHLFKISFSQSLSVITLIMIWLVAVATFVFTRVGLFMVGIIQLQKNMLIYCVILFKEIFKVVFTSFYISMLLVCDCIKNYFFKVSMLRDSTASKFILKSFLLLKNSDSCTNILIPLPLRFFLV